MAIIDASPETVAEYKSRGKWLLPCQMVFVLKPLTTTQITESGQVIPCKCKSRLVICGNFAAWSEQSTSTTNLDAPLLRLMLSMTAGADTTYSSIDITSAFLNADIASDNVVLVTPPPVLVKMGVVQPNTVWQVRKAVYGLREAPRLWQEERDEKLMNVEFHHLGVPVHLVRSHIHRSLWFIVKGPKKPVQSIPPFDHTKRSDEWASTLHKHDVMGYMGVYVDDLLIAGYRRLNDDLIRAVQCVWDTSTPEHLGPDEDSVPVLRFLGMK